MSVTFWTALLLQFAAVVLLRLGLGKTWLRRPVTLLVLASVVYDGLSQVVLYFPSVAVWDIFRKGIQHNYINEAALIMSAGMLALTVAYLLSWPRPGEVPPFPQDTAVAAAKVLDWRLLALACLPLAVLTYKGRGFNASLAAGAGLATSTAAEFFVLLVTLAVYGFLLRHGTRWFTPALLAQSALLAAAGERAPVIWGAVTLVLLLACAGRSPQRRQGLAALALTMTAILAVTGARAAQGRGVFTSDTGLSTRVSALGSGVTSADAAQDTPGLIAQAAERLDGTAFTAAVLQGYALGQPRLQAAGVPESLLLAVPSVVWDSKLSDAALNPYQTEINDFGLQQVNFLPTFTGLYAGFLLAPWLIAFLAGLGALAGRGERWLLRRQSPARTVLLAGAFMAALRFEEGLPAMLVVLRSAAAVAVLAWLGTAHSRRAYGVHLAGLRARGQATQRIIASPGPPGPPMPPAPP